MANTVTHNDKEQLAAPPLPFAPPLKPFAKLARQLGLHTATLGRWRDKGILHDGERVRLWACRLGGRWMSTDEALAEFVGRLNARDEIAVSSSTRSPATRSKASAVAERELDRIGI